MFAFRKDNFSVDGFTEARLRLNLSLAELASGLVSGTFVGTSMGWRDVAAVAVGDQVLTFDRGLQTVASVTHQQVSTRGSDSAIDSWLVHVPVGVLGNAEAITLLPSQPVMIETDIAEEIFGDPFVVVTALALAGFGGITQVPPSTTTHIITLAFDRDEVVFANAGSLLVCPASTDLLDAHTRVYPTLTDSISALLVNAMKIDRAAKDGYQAAA